MMIKLIIILIIKTGSFKYKVKLSSFFSAEMHGLSKRCFERRERGGGDFIKVTIILRLYSHTIFV